MFDVDLNMSLDLFKVDLKKYNGQTPHSISPPPPYCWGGTTFSLKFRKGGDKKNECLGGLNSSCHGYLPGGLLCFLSKKNLKIKYGSKGSISNVDLGLI